MSLRRTPAKPQWQPVVDGLRAWLHNSSALPLAPSEPSATCVTCPIAAGFYRSWRLSDLLGCPSCTYLSATRTSVESHQLYRQQEQFAAIHSLLDFVVSAYGLELLPAMLRGFAQHEDWKTLAPAVLGVSAAELEAAWHIEDAAHPKESGTEH
jgi:hypothetical protein